MARYKFNIVFVLYCIVYSWGSCRDQGRCHDQ